MISSSRIGLVTIPKQLEQKITEFMKRQSKPAMKECVERIHHSLMSTGSQKLLDQAIRKAKENQKRIPSKQPHSLSYDKFESAAYVGARMIPTYAAVFNIFYQLKKRIPEFQPTSVLDFGCGPGSAVFAAKEWYPITEAIGIDTSEAMLDILVELMEDVELKTQRYLSLAKPDDLQSDLVISAFTLSDLPSDSIRNMTVKNLWNQTKDVLVLVDRGTPIGAQLIAQARQQILDYCKQENQECYIVAPCAHEVHCPMLNNPHKHWCHFSQKYQMIQVMVFLINQRTLKNTKTSQSDMKFSFVVMKRGKRPGLEESEESRAHYAPRLIMPPLKRKGHVVLDYCTNKGTLERTVVSKAHPKPSYTTARKSYWGDLWPLPVHGKSTVWSGQDEPTVDERITDKPIADKPTYTDTKS